MGRKAIWDIRLERLQRIFLDSWSSFTIWNAGKQGRKLYRSLPEKHRIKVQSFCDVDAKKIQLGVYVYEDSKERPKPKVPIVHFTSAKPPFVICVKLVRFGAVCDLHTFFLLFNYLFLCSCKDLTKGDFEANLKSLNLRENIDYILFS